MLPSPRTAVPLETTATRLPRPGIGIGEGRIVGDGEAGVGDAGGIGHRQVFLGKAGFDGKDFKLSRAGFLMVGEGLFLGEQRHDDLLWFGFK